MYKQTVDGLFDDESYTDADKEFLLKAFDEYADEDTLDDPLLLRRTVSAVKTLLQADKIDRIINAQLSSPSPDSALIGKLSSVKSSLMSSAELPERSGAKSFTKIMKEMNDAAYESAKPDVIDAKLSGSYKEIAAMNARALIDELNITGDEYAALAARQSEMISELQERCQSLGEEIRKLRKGGGRKA